MSKKDKASWDYFQDETRFADAINACCYGGRQVVKPKDVLDADTRNKNCERDLIRKTVLGIRYVFIGIENQETVDYSLPVRIMGSDYGDYKKQVDKIKRKNRKRMGKASGNTIADHDVGELLYDYKKTDKIFPVITIVFYYGDNWDGPKSIKDMLDLDKDLDDSICMQNYGINLIEVNSMTDAELDRFQTDIKQVFKFIKNRKDKDKMLEIISSDPYYRNVEKTAHDMMKVHGGLRAYNIKEEDYRSEEGGIDMCRAWDDWREDGRNEGRTEGRKEGQDLINRLNSWLVKQGRTDEMLRSFDDRELQQQLILKMEESEGR